MALLLVTVTLSMMTTPLLMTLIDKFSRDALTNRKKMKRRGLRTINRR
jgi:Kef-type K+ transport system membrane component KefB